MSFLVVGAVAIAGVVIICGGAAVLEYLLKALGIIHE